MIAKKITVTNTEAEWLKSAIQTKIAELEKVNNGDMPQALKEIGKLMIENYQDLLDKIDKAPIKEYKR